MQFPGYTYIRSHTVSDSFNAGLLPCGISTFTEFGKVTMLRDLLMTYLSIFGKQFHW